MAKYKELTDEVKIVSTYVKAVGNIYDTNWDTILLKESKTPKGILKSTDTHALLILGDVVNRYNQIPIYGTTEGRIIAYRTNFNGDFYDQSTSYYANRWGVSRATIANSINLLKRLGLIYNIGTISSEGNKQYLIANGYEIALISNKSKNGANELNIKELAENHLRAIQENYPQYSPTSKPLKLNSLEEIKKLIRPTLQPQIARVETSDCNSIIYHNKSFSSLHSEKEEKKAYRISASQKSDSAVISFLSYRKISERLLVDNSVFLDLHCDLTNFGTFNKKTENLFLVMFSFLESNKECKAALKKSMKSFSVQVPYDSFINSWAMSYMSSVKTEKKCSIEHLFLQLQNYCKNNKLAKAAPKKTVKEVVAENSFFSKLTKVNK